MAPSWSSSDAPVRLGSWSARSSRRSGDVPSLALIDYDARNVDGEGNTTLSPGSPIATWKNLGRLGSIADALRSVPEFQPSLVEGPPVAVSFAEGGRSMNTLTLPALSQPVIFAGVARWGNALSNVYVWGGSGSTGRADMRAASTGRILASAGTSLVSSIDAVTGRVDLLAALFNGASSVVSVNGTRSPGDAGTQEATSLTLGAYSGGSSNHFDGELMRLLVVPASQASLDDVEAYLAAEYGPFPQ